MKSRSTVVCFDARQCSFVIGAAIELIGAARGQ